MPTWLKGTGGRRVADGADVARLTWQSAQDGAQSAPAGESEESTCGSYIVRGAPFRARVKRRPVGDCEELMTLIFRYRPMHQLMLYRQSCTSHLTKLRSCYGCTACLPSLRRLCVRPACLASGVLHSSASKGAGASPGKESRICNLSTASTVFLTFVKSTVHRLHCVQASTVHISGVPGL